MYLFKLQCEKSDKILRERLQKTVCTDFKENSLENGTPLKLEDTFVEEDTIIEEKNLDQKKNHEEKILIDDLDNFDFDSFDNDSEPESDFETKKVEPQSQIKLKEFHCEICHKQFSRNDLLLRHKIAHAIKMEDPKHSEYKRIERTPVIYSDINVINLKSEEYIYSCPSCDMLFVNKDDFDHHFQENHEKKQEYNVTCDVCSEKFSKLSHKNRHMKKVHFLDKQYKCPTCEKSFSKKEQMEHHVNSHLGKKPHTCDICLKGEQCQF